jgi:regulator of cell morphogenesis and NO signaling
MGNFNKSHKVVEIIEHDNTLLGVISRFGVRLGFGEDSVEEICAQHQIDPEFFLTIINVYHNESYFPEKKFEQFRIRDIVEYLTRSHQYYKSFVLPDIERQFSVMMESEAIQKDIFALLVRIYNNFKTEFHSHIEEEEKSLFPFAVALEDAKEKASAKPLSLPEFDFVNIHTHLDDTIYDIKNILIKYMPLRGDIYSINAFAMSIFRFEKDLKDHSKIEDLILYPKVKHLYAQLSD